MAQVLPYVPGFVEQLFEQIKPGAGALGSYLGGRMKLNATNEKFGNKYPEIANQIGVNSKGPQQAPGEPITPMDGMPQTGSRVYTPLEQAEITDFLAQNKGKPFADTYIKGLQEQNTLNQKEQIQIRKEQREEAKKQKEVSNSKRILQRDLGTMGRILGSDTIGMQGAPFTKSNSLFNRASATNRKQFDNINEAFVGAARDLASKGGQFTNDKFKYVLENTAKSDKSDRENLGALLGSATALDLDPTPIIEAAIKLGIDPDELIVPGFVPGKEQENDETPKSKKVPNGTKLTPEILRGWIDEGLSRKQSEERAKELGYEF